MYVNTQRVPRGFIHDIIRDLVSRCHAEDNKCLYPPTSPFPSVFRSSSRKRVSLGNPGECHLAHGNLCKRRITRRAFVSRAFLSF